jgi:AcrR family transcriptional regulator
VGVGISERRRGARLRQKILNAARDLFAAQGYEAVTMREIARRSNTADRDLLHFKDKEALINELYTVDCTVLANGFSTSAVSPTR